MADKTADAFKFNLRLPKPLHKRLLRDAKKRKVSLNTQIVDELSHYQVETVRELTLLLHEAITKGVREVAQAGGVNLSPDDVGSIDEIDEDMKKRLRGTNE